MGLNKGLMFVLFILTHVRVCLGVEREASSQRTQTVSSAYAHCTLLRAGLSTEVIKSILAPSVCAITDLRRLSDGDGYRGTLPYRSTIITQKTDTGTILTRLIVTYNYYDENNVHNVYARTFNQLHGPQTVEVLLSNDYFYKIQELFEKQHKENSAESQKECDSEKMMVGKKYNLEEMD